MLTTHLNRSRTNKRAWEIDKAQKLCNLPLEFYHVHDKPRKPIQHTTHLNEINCMHHNHAK